MPHSASSEKPNAASTPKKILSKRIRPRAASAIETLEPRVVCAVNIGAGLASLTALSNSQINEIVNGLEDLGSLGDALEAQGVLATDIPALGISFGELLDFGTANGRGGFLGDAFRDQLHGLLNDPAWQPTGPTVSQINTWLNTSPLAGTTGAYKNVSWSLVQGGEYAGAHPLEWEVTIAGKQNTENDLALGSDATAAGITLTTAPKVSTDAGVSFTFSFGLTDTDQFFATLGVLNFTVDGTQPLVGMTGAVSYTAGGNTYPFNLAAGSTVALSAGFGNVTLTEPGTPNGEWSRAELSGLAGAITPTDFNVGTTTDTGLQAKLHLATVGGTPVQLLLDDNAVLDATPPAVGHDVALVDYVVGGNVTGVFQRIQDVGALLDLNPLRDLKIPGIGTALSAMGELPAYSDLLALRDTANNYITTVATPTFNGLASQLNTFLTAQLATAGITLSTLGLTTEFDPATSSMLLKFTVDTGDITKTFDFDRFGAAATQAGISFGRDGNFQLDATLRAQGNFAFGIDLTKTASSTQSVFFASGGLGATVDFDVIDMDLGITLGPVSADIVNGQIHATAGLALQITDATDDGRYTLQELNNGSEVAFGFTPTGTFAAELPLDIKVAGATFTNPTIKLGSANIFTQLPTLDTTTPNFEKIFNLGKIGPEAILDLIIATGEWASNFRNAPVFDVNIPFLKADLGNAFDFGLLFTKNLRDKLQNNVSYVALAGDFASFTLVSAAPLVLGDGGGSEAIVLPAATYATKTSLITALNMALGATTKFKAEAHGDNGVRIAAKDSNNLPNFAIVGPTYLLKQIGFVPSSTVVTSEVTLPLDAPTNGKITGDAKITVSVDGGAPVTITLLKTATDDNTSVANLASDLDAALTSQGIDAVAVGGKLKLVRADGKSFMVAGVSGTKFQQVGIENASAAGLTNAGSTLQTGLTYSTLTDMVPVLLTALGLPDDGDGDPSNDPISARYDIATESIIVHFEHTFTAPTLTLPVGINFDLSGWAGLHTIDANGRPTNPTLSFTPTIGGSFDLGINLANQSGFDELAITAPTGFAPNGYGEKADGSPDGNNALAWDGKLAANAVFTISFDDGVAHTLTIAKSATTTNTTAADILVDVKAAIAANSSLTGKLDARLIARQGGSAERIEFFTKSQTGDFQIRNLRVQAAANTMGFDADRLELSTAPSLAVTSNSQATLDYSPAGAATFTISLDGGSPVQISASAASMAANTTMADLIADLNAAIAGTSLDGKVRAIRYGAGTEIQFIAADGTKQMSVNGDSVAAQTTLNFGTDKIVTRSRGGTFFVENASLDASGTLTLADTSIAANLGFIGITTTGLAGSVTIAANATLTDGTNTRFEVSELLDRVGNGTIGAIVETDFDGTATATMSGLQIDAGLLNVGVNAEVQLTASDIFATRGANFAVAFNGFDPTKLTNFSHASWQQIYEGIKLGVQFLSKTEQFNFLGNTKIPLINQSITEIFTYTDKLVAVIDELQTNPAGALAEVEARVEELLGIPAENFSLTLDANSVLKIHLGLSASFAASYGLDFDLTTLASYTNATIPADLLTLGGFLDASAEGSLQVGVRAGLTLDLGLDFSAPGAPALSVYTSSGVDLGVRVSGENLNINASFGPAGFAIVDGSVLFDSDGLLDDDNYNGIEDKAESDGAPLVPGPLDTWVDDDLQDNDFATIHFGPLATITDLSGTISAISGGAAISTYFGPSFTGKIVATLPGAITSDIGRLDLPGPIVVTVPDASKLFSSDPLVRKDSVQLTLPDMSDLLPEVPGLIQLLRDPAILLDGVDSALGLIQKGLSGKTATKLPLIGDQLRSGAGFIQEFRAGFIADLTTKLRGAGDTLLATMQTGMFDLFAADTDGANGLALGILQDYNGDGSVTADDVVLTFRKADGSIWVDGTDSPAVQEAVQFNLHLGQSITFATTLDIDWGLPGLDLDITGSPSITAGWDLFFGFGVSVNDFFYLDSAPPEEFTGSGATLAAGAAASHVLSLHFNAVLTSNAANPFTAKGRLFFLQLDALDQEVSGEYSHVSGEFFVDLIDPGTGSAQDGRVTVKELFSRGAIKPITAGLEAEAIVNIGLTGSVAGSAVVPRILADFHLDWSFVAGQPVTAPNVSFENVQLDLGSFISDFLKPIVNKVNEIIKPFDPVLDALQTRIPVLSDIMGRDYTVLDLAVQFGNVDRRFIDAVLGIRSLVADIAALPDNTNILIDLGDLAGLGSALMTKDGAKGVTTSGSTAVGFGSGDPAAFKNAFNKSATLSGGGFGFPILKPANAFKLLLGQEATLVTYDIPRLEVSMSMVQRFRIWGPLIGKFSGSITAYADFAVGFDTKGFNTYRTSGDVLDILDGFFVSDRANADGTGADVPEAGFFGRIGIAGAINAGVIEAGIEGFFELRADLDLKDPNNDGKVRGSEMLALLTHPNGYGPLNLGSITLNGQVGARAYVDFWAPFDWYNAWEWEFARVTLFDKTFSAPDVTPTLATAQMVGAENTVTLNAGPTATKRNFISTSDVGEAFEITGTGKNITVKFVNTGDTQTFTNIDRIVLNGGKGDDSIKIAAGVTTAITFDGGEGDDYFEGGAGNDIVFGGTGNDTLIGGGGNNTLDGGDGADLITGGAGDDVIIGGLGDDTLNGLGGADTYRFANEWGNDIFDGNQTGTGAFDFSSVTTDLTLNISASGALGTSGNSFISFDSTAPYITSLKGGSGNDVATIAATGTSAVTVDGGGGSDQYLVSFGRLSTAINLADTGTGANDSDSVTVRPLTRDYTIRVGDLYVSGTKTGLATAQTANFTSGIENLTVDAKANGGSIVQIAEAISLTGNVRILARQAIIGNTIDAGDVRVESTQAVNIAANVNAHDNGSVTVLVNGGNITITEDVMSSSGAGFTGDGAGLVHLFTSGGAILTGGTAADHGRVLASAGSLLLRGTNGSIGTLDTPIYSTVSILSASTTGNGLVNVHESDGLIIGTIASIAGIKTTGGIFNVFNDAGELRVAAPIALGGGDGTLTSDSIEIDADISSAGGAIFLRPEGMLTTMAVGNGVTGTFALDQSEIDHLLNGLASVRIGQPTGRNLINLGTANFVDPVLLQNPVLGGHINQTGIVTVGDGGSFTILGSGHTTELNNQNVAGNIDIIDSAIVREGETATLTSTGGAININFNLDGTTGGVDETLQLNAAGNVVIKGAIGSVAQLSTLRIMGATNIRFEGAVNVKHLILDAGTTFTADGTFNAEDIAFNGVASATFHSGVVLTTGLTTSGSVLTTAIFEGQVTAPSITLTAKQLVDFYQLVDVTTTLNVKTTNATGDITFRQQVDAHAGSIVVQALDDITFIGPVAGDTLTVTSADVLAMQANTVLTGGFVQSAGTGIATFAQFTAASANINAAGVILGGVTTLNGASGLVVNVGSGAFSASNAVSAPSGPVNITARTIAFQGTVAANASMLTATENITVANASSFTLTNALNATTTNAGLGEIKFTGPLDVGTNAIFNTPRQLTFQNTIEVDGALTVQAASSAQYQGPVTVGGAFTQQAGVTGAASFSSTVNAGSLTLQAGSLSFTGDVTSSGAAGLTSNIGGITATGNVTASGALTANAFTNLSLQGATTAHSMALTATTSMTSGSGGLTTAASPTTGNIQIMATGAGNSVTLNGPVNVKGALGVNARSISFQSTVAANNATLTAIETITAANASSFTIGGALAATTSSPTVGEIKFTGPVDVATNAIFNTPRGLTFQNALDVDGALTVQAASTALYQGAVTVGDVFTQQAGVIGAATFSSTVQAGSLAVQAGSLAFNGDVASLGAADVTSNTGGITVTGNVSVAGVLTANAFTNLALQGATAAHAMALNSVGTTTVGAGGLSTAVSPTAGNIAITTTGAVAGNSVTLNGPVNAKGSFSIDAARGVLATDNLQSGSLLNIVSQRGVALSVVDAGSVNVDALSINLPSAVAATGAITLKADATGNIVAGSTIAAGGALSISRAKAITTSGLVSGNSASIGQGGTDSIETISIGVGGMTAVNDLRIRTTVAGTGNGIVTQGPLTAGNAATIALDSARGVDVTGGVGAGNLSVNGTTVTLRSPINVSNNVTLSSPGALSVDRDLNVAGNVSVTQAGALTFGAVLEAANLTIANTASASFTGAVGIANNATIAVTGNLTSASAINVGGALSIPTGAVITLNSAVTAGSATIAGGTLVTGGDVTTTSGALAIATSGDVSIAGKTTVAQTLGITGSDDVTLSGAIVARDFSLNATSFLAGGAFTTNVGGATITTTGNIRVVGLASIAQDLTVNSALNTTFQGQVAVTGAFTQTNGSGTTRFEGVTNAANINVRTAQQIFSGSTFRANGGDIRLEADEIDFTGGTNAVQGAANLTLRPYNAATTIDVGSPTPTGVLDLSDSDLNALQDGFARIVIGRAEDATGAMLIGSSSFKDNVAFHAGSIVVENNPLVGQVVTTLESLELTARAGSITTNDDLFGTDAVLTARDNITINNKVEVADFITLIAGTDGSGAVTLNGALKTTAGNGATNITTGLNGGDLTITGTLTSTAAALIVPNGAILQASGRTTVNDIVALAKSGITLRTTADHISARVISAGDISISDTNVSDTHVLHLGSQTDVNDGLFTNNGRITVLADQSVNAYRIQANGAVSIESGGEVYVDQVIGAPVHVTGTILIDTDRTTNGEQIRFDGNLRLLRDITLTSNGGDIIITGRVNGTAGQQYGLTVNAGGADVTIGGPIGNTTPVAFLQINDADAFSLNGGARTVGDLEINADSIAIVAPVGSILTTGGGALRLLPNDAAASIDLGLPTGGAAEFSLSDAELASLGNGFSFIQIGQSGGMHDVTLESARLLDDVEINGDNVTLLQSSVIQGVNGLSVVNGTDDNDITINARTSFTQGTRAALAAGRNGHIAITADSIALDAKSRGIVRGFGELLLQPLTPSREMTLGGGGVGFELTADEFGALGNSFSKITIGRADGAHAVSITKSLSFRDTTEIRTPLDGGSVTIGSSLAPITVQTVGRGDNLRITSGGDITVDGNLKTVGRGSLELLADFDGNGTGDLLIGQHLSARNKSVNLGSEFGAIRLQGENVVVGARVPGVRDAGFASIASFGGDIGISTNLDGDADGGFAFHHARNTVKTAGIVDIASVNHGGVADLIGGIIGGRRGVNIHGFDSVSTAATQVTSNRLIAIEAMSETLKAGSSFTSLAEIQIFGNAATGVLSIEEGATISATRTILLDAADVQRARGSIVRAKTVTVHEL